MNGRTDRAKALLDMLENAAKEVDQDVQDAMSSAHKKLDEIAREILRLERDMTLPGSSSSDNVRTERLMNFIESKEF